MFKKKILIIALIIAMLIPIITYAYGTSNQNEKFFSTDKNEATPGETITMNIDLSQINYEDFEFNLTSNINIEDVTMQQDIDTSLEENSLKIISSKSLLNMQKISLYYKIPEDTEIGTIINLTGKIKKYEDTNKVDDEFIDSKEIDTENMQESDAEKIEEHEIKISIKIVEKQNTEETFNSNKQNEEFLEKNNAFNLDDINNKESRNEYSSNKITLLQTSAKAEFSNGSQSITYNGDSNNYLSSLQVEGYNINPTFSKTNNTYFISVSKDITSLTINASAENENSKISIYGNENLQDGENKILISVTAENGDVKIYRIYVTKQ